VAPIWLEIIHPFPNVSAGKSLDMDRLLKSNTSRTRTHSLFRQGCMLYELIPNMPENRLTAFAKAMEKIDD
jgi:hypothetical protein